MALAVETGIKPAYRNSRLVLHSLTMALLMLSAPSLAQQSGQQQDQNANGQSGNGQSSANGQSTGRQPGNSASSGYAPVDITPPSRSADDANDKQRSVSRLDKKIDKKPSEPSEFEKYVSNFVGHKVKRFGADLLLPQNHDYTDPTSLTIPADYPIGVGDVVSVNLTGSVEGSVEFPVDSNGKIFLPHIGEVSVIGVRYRDLKAHISSAIGMQYRGFDVSVNLKKLHGIRVYVTGFADAPGVYTVSSLATLVNAVLAAGGPNSGGSLRSVKLYRNGSEIRDFDLYDILRKGDRSRDPILQNEDVLFIPPVGKQVAVVGSANEEAVYELRKNETLLDVVALAGGGNQLADPDRAILYRLRDKDTVGSRELAQLALGMETAEGGDIVQILPKGSLTRPIERQSVLVRLEGEVVRPGNYFVSPGTPVAKVIEMAGGFTERAFVYGTVLNRSSVREQQRESFRAAIQQLEQMVNSSNLVGYSLASQTDREAQIASSKAVLQRLREAEPDGRLVMDLALDAHALPQGLVLENNDRIYIPPRIETVGVFGAVYRPASFLLDVRHVGRISDYIERAGGVQRAADNGGIFVVHANGEVVTRKRGGLGRAATSGDVVFVPVRTQSSSVLAKIKDFTQILFQAGIGAAAIKAIM